MCIIRATHVLTIDWHPFLYEPGLRIASMCSRFVLDLSFTWFKVEGWSKGLKGIVLAHMIIATDGTG